MGIVTEIVALIEAKRKGEVSTLPLLIRTELPGGGGDWVEVTVR